MVKSKEDTIAEFNEQVNMSVEELETWLKDPTSRKAGTGVGLESAKKIIEILKKNPDKDPSKYEEVSGILKASSAAKLKAECAGGPRTYAKGCGVGVVLVHICAL